MMSVKLCGVVVTTQGEGQQGMWAAGEQAGRLQGQGRKRQGLPGCLLCLTERLACQRMIL